MLQKLLLLAGAGALGTLARYGLAGMVQKMSGSTFPWGTFAVNLLGCFLAGLVFSIAATRLSISSQTRIVIMMGFMGAFTTFSAFMLETGQLIRDSEWLLAAGNLLMQNVLGIALLFSGLVLGRYI